MVLCWWEMVMWIVGWRLSGGCSSCASLGLGDPWRRRPRGFCYSLRWEGGVARLGVGWGVVKEKVN